MVRRILSLANVLATPALCSSARALRNLHMYIFPTLKPTHKHHLQVATAGQDRDIIIYDMEVIADIMAKGGQGECRSQVVCLLLAETSACSSRRAQWCNTDINRACFSFLFPADDCCRLRGGKHRE